MEGPDEPERYILMKVLGVLEIPSRQPGGNQIFVSEDECEIGMKTNRKSFCYSKIILSTCKKFGILQIAEPGLRDGSDRRGSISKHTDSSIRTRYFRLLVTADRNGVIAKDYSKPWSLGQ